MHIFGSLRLSVDDPLFWQFEWSNNAFWKTKRMSTQQALMTLLHLFYLPSGRPSRLPAIIYLPNDFLCIWNGNKIYSACCTRRIFLRTNGRSEWQWNKQMSVAIASDRCLMLFDLCRMNERFIEIKRETFAQKPEILNFFFWFIFSGPFSFVVARMLMMISSRVLFRLP